MISRRTRLTGVQRSVRKRKPQRAVNAGRASIIAGAETEAESRVWCLVSVADRERRTQFPPFCRRWPERFYSQVPRAYSSFTFARARRHHIDHADWTMTAFRFKYDTSYVAETHTHCVGQHALVAEIHKACQQQRPEGHCDDVRVHGGRLPAFLFSRSRELLGETRREAHGGPQHEND